MLQSNCAGPIRSICPGSVYSTCLLDFRDRYQARSGLFDHVNNDGFDCWSGRLFHSPHGFLRCRAFGLHRSNSSLFCLRSPGDSACFTALSRVSSSRFCSLLYLLLTFSHDRSPSLAGASMPYQKTLAKSRQPSKRVITRFQMHAAGLESAPDGVIATPVNQNPITSNKPSGCRNGCVV
jgi:hypothetical protein